MCGEPDPLEALSLTLLSLDGDVASIAVENISESAVTAGTHWRASSEKNDRFGSVTIGSLNPGEVRRWDADLGDLGVDLTEHLGAGEFHVWPCLVVNERCRLLPTVTRLHFLAGDGRVELGEGDVPAYASEAGRQLAERSGLLSFDDAEASGSSNLSVRVEKRSSSVDWRPEPNEGRGGEE